MKLRPGMYRVDQWGGSQYAGSENYLPPYKNHTVNRNKKTELEHCNVWETRSKDTAILHTKRPACIVRKH